MPLPPQFDAIPLLSWSMEYGPFTPTYTAVDVESTGVDPKTDYILQVGWTSVKNSTATLSADLVIDWPSTLSGYALTDFTRRLDETRERMKDKDKAYPWTIEFLRERGKPPREVATRLAKLLPEGCAVAGHYSMNLDFPMIGRFMAQYGGGFAPDVTTMYDTCLLVKACFAAVSPMKDEDPLVYYKRIADLPHRGPKTKLESCLDHFDLKDQGLAKKNAHLAGFDSFAVHMIFERLRAMVPDLAAWEATRAQV